MAEFILTPAPPAPPPLLPRRALSLTCDVMNMCACTARDPVAYSQDIQNPVTYSDVCHAALGRGGLLAVECALVASQAGFSTAYLVFIARYSVMMGEGCVWGVLIRLHSSFDHWPHIPAETEGGEGGVLLFFRVYTVLQSSDTELLFLISCCVVASLFSLPR